MVMTAGVQTHSKNILLKEGTVKTLKPQMSVEQIHLPLSNCESQCSTETFLSSGSGKTCGQCTSETF